MAVAKGFSSLCIKRTRSSSLISHVLPLSSVVSICLLLRSDHAPHFQPLLYLKKTLPSSKRYSPFNINNATPCGIPCCFSGPNLFFPREAEKSREIMVFSAFFPVSEVEKTSYRSPRQIILQYLCISPLFLLIF